MPRVGLDRAAVVAAAARVADAEGLAAVTLARVAGDLGVRPPSLYNHVDGLYGLLHDLAVHAVRLLDGVVRDAAVGRAGADALVAIADACRAFAVRHPGLHALTVRAPAPGDEELAAVSESVVAVFLAVLRAQGIEGDDAIHRTRALRAAVFGFATLESGGGFGIPVDVDESFRRMVEALASP